MREIVSAIALVAGVVGILLTAHLGPAAALELISAQEAALPDADGVAFLVGFRGVTRGPSVSIVSPAPQAGAVTSPLDLVLKFESHGGAAIEPLSFTMTYLKKPALNITPRIGQLIKPSGIEIRSAEIAPGTHYIRTEVKDNLGRLGSAVFVLTVTK